MRNKQRPAETAFPNPPEHLSARSKQLWQSIGPGQAKSLERRTLFQTALEALDRADEARRLVVVEGMTTTTATTGAVHINPVVKVERESRAQFVRIWDLLNFLWNHDIDGEWG